MDSLVVSALGVADYKFADEGDCDHVHCYFSRAPAVFWGHVA